MVKVRDGRPIKIEGNDLSPVTKGGTSAIVQASVLELYDSHRFQNPIMNNTETDWDSVDKTITGKLEQLSEEGKEIALLTSGVISPSTKNVIHQFSSKYNNVRHVIYDASPADGILEANNKSFNRRIIPDYRIDKAECVVSFAADFLGTWLSPVEYTKRYAGARKLRDGGKSMLRHIQVESNMSLTGSNADERHIIKPSQQKAVITALYQYIFSKLNNTTVNISDNLIDIPGIAEELLKHKGKSIVLSNSNDPETQIIINGINSLLGNIGETIDFQYALLTRQGNEDDLHKLIERMKSGQVGAIIIQGVNPCYDSPHAEDFKLAVKKVDVSISFAVQPDETSALTKFVCPDNHYLESWNDAEPKPGHFSLSQPVIHPIFNTRQFQDSLLKWSNSGISYKDIIKNHWEAEIYPKSTKLSGFHDFWLQSLQDGIFNIKQNSISPPEMDFTALRTVLSNQKIDESHVFELEFYEKTGLGNGLHANNPWLQEIPDPVSKVCWGNYASISPKLANEKGLKNGDVIRLNRQIELPVYIQPGQEYRTIGVALGYGRTNAGKVANSLGVNVFPLIKMHNGYRKNYAIVNIETTGKNIELALTQSHHSMEGLPLAREATLEEYVKNPAAGNELHKKVEEHHTTLYEKYDYKGHHWGLAIDLTVCTGCSACVVGCVAENNIPVVGKDEVTRAHEMHWIRIDRYYSGSPENPEVIRQPVLCQHCDNAPCENVCPVSATNHSSEGINQMAYNRCIGTRYCNNNCPYKVRRFNWYDYNKSDAIPDNTVDPAGMTLDLPRMVLNPDVTVRAKGVMEKCTFCVQRIQEKKLEAKLENRPLKDGEIRTACQQACPANAIVFGDLNDEYSEVSKLFKNPGNYHLLEEIHTLPTVGYLTKIKNKKSQHT